MRLVGAELVESRRILPGRLRHTYRAPAIATGSRAGQYVHVRPDDWTGRLLRTALPLDTTDPASGLLTLEVSEADAAPASGGPGALARLRPGDTIDMLGPLGRPFEVDPRARHLLLVAAGGGVTGLRLLVDEAIRDGRSVVLLAGSTTAREVYPSSLLPDEVEYVVATEDGSLGHHGSVVELVPEYEAWADQAFASGPFDVLAAVADLARGRRERLGVAQLGRKRGGGRAPAPGSPEARRRSFLQVLVEQRRACAVATCLGCVVMGAGGMPQRVCREGPVFASDELAWESPWQPGMAAS